MSSVPVKENVPLIRMPVAVPSFLVLWLGMVLFLVFLSFSLKSQLREYERQDVERRLTAYLNNNPVSDLPLDISRLKGETGALQGLAFLRLVRNGEQILLAESSSEQLDFHRLAGLDPKQSGIWIALNDPRRPGPWTIMTRSLSNNVLIQAGKEQSATYLLYSRIVKFCWLASIGAGILAMGLTLICLRYSLYPIRKACSDISAILADGKKGMLLPEDRVSGDRKHLYDHLNKLLQHNRQLITEMQASLDNVAHDLRTPMTRLRAVAEYGLQADSDPERLRESLSDCLEESERVLSMLAIMMSVAEAESGTMHLRKEWVELEISLNDIISLYEYVAEEKKILVKSHMQSGVWILADRTRIAQVWANLLDNSIKYGKEGGYVDISVIIDGAEIIVVFEDNGIGISKNEINRIWDRLYRGDRSRSQPGLGLGLNYVRAVVEAHGGIVSVESELQRGTRFTVRLKDDQWKSVPDVTILRSQISGA
jgi:signal transduction histidine kinase